MDEPFPQPPGEPAAGKPQFPSDSRFQVLRLLGAGGMGVVYEVFDRERNCRAALKTLRQMSPTALYHFKREFRSLSQMAHSGLIQLYELIFDGANWFFTMELVEGGVDLMTYLTEPAGSPGAPETDSATPLAPQPESERSVGPLTDTAPQAGRQDTLGLAASLTAAGGAGVPPSGGLPEKYPQKAELQPARATDYDRLRRTLALLAEAVCALHAHGKLHRDIKPSNALVTPQGRVVLLDFGLVAEVQHTRLPDSAARERAPSAEGGSWQQASWANGRIVGTVNYMSPEQAGGEPLGEASDWYAVGVILYRALTGRLPHTGSHRDVLEGKRTIPPSDPALFAPGAPADLLALCRDLLKIDPAGRPTGAEVLSRLGLAPALTCGPAAPFVGRSAHLAALHAAFAAPEPGGAVVVAVRGRSGAGKSTLVAKFLEQVHADPSVVVLAGRCYEQEAVPYKAVDSIIDALTRHLLGRIAEDGDAGDLLGPDLPYLARIFPVLLRLPGIGPLPARVEVGRVQEETVWEGPRPEGTSREQERPEQDVQAIRTRAVGALRLLLSRLASGGRLILYIDDLQWGDQDSAALLARVLEAPTDPRLMLVVAYRDEYRDSSPCVAAFHQAVFAPPQRPDGRGLPDGPRFEIEVDELSPEAARDLAARLLDPATADREALAGRIAREAGGNPLFIAELARQVRDPTADRDACPASGEANLDEVLWRRVSRLPEEARRLLETLAVAGRPLSLRTAQAAAERVADYRLLAELRSGHLLRSSGPRLDDEVAPYHDRVRESILSRLTPDALRGYHARLAAVLEAAQTPEPDVLAHHHHQAGNLERALRWYVAAADQASAALAFDRAAGLYRTALEVAAQLEENAPVLRPEAPATGLKPRAPATAIRAQDKPAAPARETLQERLADALGNLGRGPEAAAEYLGAAAAAGPEATLRLKGKAAFQFCISGHVDEGWAAFREVLREVGMKMPARPLLAVVSVLALRLWLRVRGLHLADRSTRPPSKAEIERIDTLRSVSVGISVVDPMVGAYFQTRGTLLALKAGDPYRAALALAWEAAHHSLLGVPGKRGTERLLAATAGAAAQANRPHAAAMADLARGIACFMEGRYREVRGHCEAAETLLDRCIDVPWERDTSKLFAIWGLLYSGDYAAAREKCTGLYRECEARGDRYMLTNLGTQVTTLLSLAAGRPAEAARNLDGVMANWTRQGFNVQHHGGVLARAYIALYNGDGLAAWREMRRHAFPYHCSLLLQCQNIRLDRTAMEARAALAAYRQTGERGWLRTADRRARRLEREGIPWAAGMAALARAGTAHARGDAAAAVDQLRRAAEDFAVSPGAHLGAAARRHLGSLLGPITGRADAAAAEEWFARHAIADPERFAATWAPGLGPVA
jgi:serine/threonine protein kinase